MVFFLNKMCAQGVFFLFFLPPPLCEFVCGRDGGMAS